MKSSNDLSLEKEELLKRKKELQKNVDEIERKYLAIIKPAGGTYAQRRTSPKVLMINGVRLNIKPIKSAPNFVCKDENVRAEKRVERSRILKELLRIEDEIKNYDAAIFDARKDEKRGIIHEDVNRNRNTNRQNQATSKDFVFRANEIIRAVSSWDKISAKCSLALLAERLKLNRSSVSRLLKKKFLYLGKETTFRKYLVLRIDEVIEVIEKSYKKENEQRFQRLDYFRGYLTRDLTSLGYSYKDRKRGKTGKNFINNGM